MPPPGVNLVYRSRALHTSSPQQAMTKTVLKSGHVAVTFDEETKKSIHYRLPEDELNLVQLHPGRLVIPKTFIPMHDCYLNFQFRPSDVVVLAYPKCGSTWMQEIVWTMKHNPDLKNKMAVAPINIRSIFLESDMWFSQTAGPPCKIEKFLIISALSQAFKTLLDFFPYVVMLLLVAIKFFPKLVYWYTQSAMRYYPPLLAATLTAVMKTCPKQLTAVASNGFDYLSHNPFILKGFSIRLCEYLDSPRVIKTHLPFSLLNQDLLHTSKVIFVLRNPKDMLVSNYKFSKLSGTLNYCGTFSEYVDSFMNGHLLYGNYALHLEEAMARRDDPNLLIVRYEDLKSDCIKEMTKIDKFLGTQLTYQQIEKIVEYTSFSEMKKRDKKDAGKLEKNIFNAEELKAGGTFFRKGVVGDWRSTFTPEISTKIDMWIKQNLDIEGLEFKYNE